MALIHVIRRADLIRELLPGTPEKATSTRDVLPPGGPCVPAACMHADVPGSSSGSPLDGSWGTKDPR